MARLFVNNLTVLDFSYPDPQRGLVGESLRVHVELAGDLDAQGMVLDFSAVKRDIKRTLDAELDHKLLVPLDLPGLICTEHAEGLDLDIPLAAGGSIRHHSPRQAVALLPTGQIDIPSLTTAAQAAIAPLLPPNVQELRLQLEPERIDGAFFHYSHGLKCHDGNCQRIAHGHRSRLEITRDGQRDPALEAAWAARWRDSYLLMREDLLGEETRGGQRCYRIGYRSAQGEFRLSLPQAACQVIEQETTIENLAQHLAERLAAAEPGVGFRTRVFEGIDKGAIGVAGPANHSGSAG